MDQDQTLNSPEFQRWSVVAAESGMPTDDITATARVRHRLLAAVWICQEAIPGAAPSDVLRIFEAIDREAASAMVEWPDLP